MLARFKNWGMVVGAVVIGVSTSACAQVNPVSLIPQLPGSSNSSDLGSDSADSSVRLTASASIDGSRPTPTLGPNQARVTSGPIEETFSALGRVASAGTTDINFQGTGKVDAVGVRAGDKVDIGQLLLQTDSTQILKDLADARTRLDNDSARVQQAIDQAAAQSRTQQLDAAQRAAQAEQQRQQAIVNAQNALRAAQATYDKVAAGPSQAETRTAQANLDNAQAALDRATLDLETLKRGPNPADVRAAQTAITNAQTDVDKAQAQIDVLNRTPDPAAIAAAERDVQRAQVALQVAQAAKVDTNNTQAMHDAGVANAKLTLQDTQDKLNAIKNPAPPDPSVVSIAQRTLQSAQGALTLAEQNLAIVKKGATPADIDAAQRIVDNATTLRDNAQDRLDELNSHPTAQELQEAQIRLNQGQRDLTDAQKPVQTNAPIDDGSAAFSIQLLQKQVAQDQVDVETLQKQLDGTRLVSPIAGIVTSVAIRAGDAVDPSRPVVVLSSGGAPVMKFDVSEQDAARIKQGQPARVLVDVANAQPIPASVVSVAPNQAAGVGRTATLKVDWPGDQPAIGTTAQVSIIVQHKDNVLLVPKKAVRSAGARRFVQYMSGSSRKVANVEVGTVTDDMVEVTSGLTEGQIVIVGP